MPSSRDAGLPPGTRRILHLDVDAFLASVEEAVHPELRGRPLVIGGSPTSRNLVMSCSYAVRRFGVRPGMSLREAQRRCPHAIFRDGDSQAANAKRAEVTRVLLRFTPKVEVASIDDFYADLTGTARLHGAAFDAAERIRACVRAEVGLPITIGVGANRLFARLAGKLAKPGGVAELLPGAELAFLHRLPVAELPGVGRAIGAKLERFSIRTVGELALVPREILFASFGRDGLAIYDRARGRDDRPVEATHAEGETGVLIVRPPKALHREATFEPEEGRRELVLAMLAYLVERGMHRVRALHLAAGALEVRLFYVETRARVEGSFDATSAGSSFAKRRAFARPTDATDAAWLAARRLFDELPRRRALVKRIGIVLHGLRPSAGWQGHLFDAGDASAPGAAGAAGAGRGSRDDRQRRLDAAVDALRAKLGFGLVLRGPSAPLAETHPLRADGYRLRTPSLNQ
jgi:DNA polymerase-4